ncbi:TRI41 ligase, partial [Chunga burmeisteri]|nr:TRI41 ligase [Chunga burmeisteri]
TAVLGDGVPSGGSSGRLNPVETLQEEAICAICLDYFVDPVSIGCGHNFCRVCISQLWGGEAEYEASPGAAAVGSGEVGMGDVLEEDLEDEEDELDEDELDDMWDGGVGGELYFGDEDYDEDVMEEDVEEEEEVEEDEEEVQTPPPPVLATRPRRLQTFTCPQCRKTFFQRNFRPNLQLANMVQIIRQLHPHPQRLAPPAAGPSVSGATAGVPGVLVTVGGQGPPNLCEKHQEPLKLFCEVDEQAICVVCRESRSHKHHSVVPLEEVVQDYKNKLQSHLEPLKKKLDMVLKQKSNEEEKITELRDKMKLEIKEFESDFELLHQFLIGEQVLLLHQLEERYESLLARQSGNINQLEEQSAALSRLIAEAEDKSKQDGLQLLKDIKGTFISRCENIKFQEPEMVPVDVGKKYRNYFLQDVVMRKMEKIFSKVPQADITLDPDTAHPRLSLSLDRRSVKLGERRQDLPENPKRFDSDYCVLGSQGFTAGRHYWEVEVGGRRGWAVGAARETARRKEKTVGPHQKREIWCVGTNGKKYQALTATEQTALSPGERPRRFGVYLDYERGQLCFYNAENMTHIHTFNASFHERIFPFFRILAKGTRIKICA